jgi:S-DNA-T family DNA segregation ATPase FtsK/SpoIIIE
MEEVITELPVTNRFFLTDNFLLGDENAKYMCMCNQKHLTINEITLNPYMPVSIDHVIVTWFPKASTVIQFPQNKAICFGSDKKNDVIVSAHMNLNFVIEPDVLHLESGTAYLNGKLVNGNEAPLSTGDGITFHGLRLTVQADRIILSCDLAATTFNIYNLGSPQEHFEDFPLYKRSPRIIKKLPDDTVNLTNPTAKPKKKKGQILRMVAPPLVMLSMTIIIQFIMPRGIFVLIGIASVLTSLVITITNYFNERKEGKEDEEQRKEQYDSYLLSQRKKLHELRKKQIESLNYHYPSSQKINDMICRYTNRIYERSANESDFLTVSVGRSTHKCSYTISSGTHETLPKDDPLLKEMEEITDEFMEIDGLPTVIDLKLAHLGLVGEKKHIQEQIHLLLNQLCFFQSYHDLELVIVFNSEHREQYDWLKWYPHCRLRAINVTGLVDSENVRDQVLGNLTQIFKERKLKQDEQKKEDRYLPHYIFVIDEPSLIINHSIMEYMQSQDCSLGFSMIYSTDMMANLPENITTVVELGDSKNAVLVMEAGHLINKRLSLEQTEDICWEHVSRSLAALTHIQGVSTQIPESISFFELFGITHPEELNVAHRWQNSHSHKSLSVPLGVRAKDDLVMLNLHEKAHGPHGLVAGTTGSGKSEIVQSYILSLAVNFHPHEVGFLLIDYKGGGMANLFEKLPHLLGTITNLDGSESMRAMASIKSELARRQRVFNINNVNHINQYNRLFKAGEADTPMPHLFLISDEFAELKKEQPDFMSELVSTARIGRSLGIHLILATQKPTGVVDDQIWSNSRFKLALKVQDAADSNEVLKTPDAANITLPGRAYLQVGNNEVYELFQSAWSGAPYNRQHETAGFDNRVYLINKLGQRQLLGEDLSGGTTDESRETQLDVVVDHIRAVYDRMKVACVERPWHPPLDLNITSPHINEIVDVAEFTDLSSAASLGISDIPEQQLQVEWQYDFVSDGNLAVFGSSGFGKSFTLLTFMLTLATKNSPPCLQFYVIDLGNAALAQMRGLPHTVDYITVDDDEKLGKFTKHMNETMQVRKILMAEMNVFNFTMYNELSEQKLAAIVVIIDNYDVIRELGVEHEDFWTKLTRDGNSVGIFTVASATRAGAFKYVVLNNFKSKISHHMIDNNDLFAIIGRTPYSLNEKPGRAFTKTVGINTTQIYTALPMKSDLSYAHAIGKLVDTLKTAYSGTLIDGLRIMPELLSHELLLQYAVTLEQGLLPIGLDFEEVGVQTFNLSNPTHLILGTVGSGKTNVLRLIIEGLTSVECVFLVDSKEMELYDYSNHENVVYCVKAEQIKDMISRMDDIIKQRKELAEARSGGTPRQFFSSLPTVCVIIDDFDNFLELLKGVGGGSAEALVQESMTVGFSYMATSLSSRMRGYDDLTKIFKESSSGLLLGSPASQSLWQASASGYKPRQDSGLYYKKGEMIPIKIPLVQVV